MTSTVAPAATPGTHCTKRSARGSVTSAASLGAIAEVVYVGFTRAAIAPWIARLPFAIATSVTVAPAGSGSTYAASTRAPVLWNRSVTVASTSGPAT